MKKKRFFFYCLFFLFFLAVLNCPQKWIRHIRYSVDIMHKYFPFASFFREKISKNDETSEQSIQLLQWENKVLQERLNNARTWLIDQRRIEEHVHMIENMIFNQQYSAFYRRRIEELLLFLRSEVFSIGAKVILRDPAFWSCGFWIDKGRKNNRFFGVDIIKRNSLVLSDGYLIGVIEDVEENRSYVKLVTDSSLVIAVRTIRGQSSDAIVLHHIVCLEKQLELQKEDKAMAFVLEKLLEGKEQLKRRGETHYLAKGELLGATTPAFRSFLSILKGRGFNYEFEDEEGQSKTVYELSPSLLHVGDVLVTSGLDELFPAGLPVARVSYVHPMKEGDYFYDIEAMMFIDVNRLMNVQIVRPREDL